MSEPSSDAIAAVVVNPDRAVVERPLSEWTKIVNTISKEAPWVIRLRSTDHEFRTDDRNIEFFNGKKCHHSIESLPYNLEKPEHVAFCKDLLKCYFAIVDKKTSQHGKR
jgi:hypothetical protein